MLEEVERRFQELGFETQISKDGDRQNVIELISFPDQLPIGRIMSASRKRFQTRFFINPFIDYAGEHDAAINAIALNPFRWKGDLKRLTLTLLHEIRHVYFRSERNLSRSNPFQIDFYADEGKKLGRKGFYDDYLTAEEVSNYFRDAQLSLQNYRQRSGTKKAVLSDLKDLRTICDMTLFYLEQARQQGAEQIEIVKTDEGTFAAYPLFRIKRGRLNSMNEGYTFVFIASAGKTPTAEEVFRDSQAKIKELINITKSHRDFASDELINFGINK